MRIRVLVALLTAFAALPASASAKNLTRARDTAVRWAVAQAGLHERGTSNRGPQIDRWERAMGIRIGQPWCGALVHQAFLRAGIRLSARLIGPDRSYRDAQAHRRGLRAIPIRSVRRGDLLFFAFRPGLLASHFALVRGRPRHGRAATVEGNVSHAVRLQVRGLAYPVLAARVTG
jgi:cell wall-associated NlpC family hydrolase